MPSRTPATQKVSLGKLVQGEMKAKVVDITKINNERLITFLAPILSSKTPKTNEPKAANTFKIIPSIRTSFIEKLRVPIA